MDIDLNLQARHILESISDAFYALDREWNFIYVNREAERLLQHTRDELIGQNVWTAFPEARDSVLFPEYHRALETGSSVEVEFYYTPLGTWFAVKAYPADYGLSVYFRDISRRKRYEEELRLSEARFRELFESMTQGVVYQDAGGRIIAANTAAQQLLGLSWDEMVGRTSPDSRWRATDESGNDFPGDRHPAMVALRTGQVVRGCVMGIFNPLLNEQRWLLVDAVPQFRNGELEPYQVYALFLDITDRFRISETLRESETQLRFMADAIPQMVWTARADGHHTYFNKRWYEFTGSPVSETDGWGWTRLLHPDDENRTRERWQYSLQTGRPYEIEYRLRRYDGVYRWHLGRGMPRRNQEGEMVEWVGTCTDIHDWKEAQEALRRSENRLSRLVNSGLLGVLYWNEKGEIWNANDKMLEIIGYDRSDLENGAIDWNVLTPESNRSQDEKAFEELYRTGTFAPYEKQIVRRDGRMVWVLVGAALLEEGQKEGLAFAIDISESKTYENELHRLNETLELRIARRTEELLNINEDLVRAERELATAHDRLYGIMESTTDRICAVDTQYRITAFNGAYAGSFGQVTGRLPEVGLNILEETSALPHIHTQVRERWKRALSGETYSIIYKLALDETSERYFESSYNPIRNERGEITGAASFTRDVTERIRTEEEITRTNARLERSNRELIQKNRELQDFAYVASHDLQEPLRKIHAFAGLLIADHNSSLDETGQYYLDRMQQAAARMTALIRDLLAFSRISVKEAVFIDVDLDEIAKGVLADLEMSIQDNGALVEVDPLPVIEADPVQMQQLFQNLIGNAIKFHRVGTTPHVHIVAQRIDHPAELPMLRLEVRDNGIGFDEKYLDRIFSPFQRLHGRDDFEGTGMGLAICRRIIERHNGEITAHSRPNEGSVFVVTLPLKQPS